MKQLDVIVQTLKDLGGKASYSELYRRYEIITGVLLTPGKKLGFEKILKFIHLIPRFMLGKKTCSIPLRAKEKAYGD